MRSRTPPLSWVRAFIFSADPKICLHSIEIQKASKFDSSFRMSVSRDDSFELYDLRVEVVCPPNERIMCGAKEGDYFLLEGEMLHLPPGQGLSIYTLGKNDSMVRLVGLGADRMKISISLAIVSSEATKNGSE